MSRRPTSDPRSGRQRLALALTPALLAVGGCTDDGAPVPSPGALSSQPSSSSSPPSRSPSATPSQTSTPSPPPTAEPVAPDDLDAATAPAVVRHLAGRIGPREGTSPAFREAVAWVDDRFTALGYDVSRQRVDVPAGVSWQGASLAAGRSANVVAAPPGFDAAEPHLVVGAHLDTVSGAPGAEDNASGVGVLLAVAEAIAERRTRLPVVLVAFGAEEPRGAGDALHHFGSRHYVASLTRAERGAVRGMVSLDRVGVGSVVPVGSARESASEPDPVHRALLAAARGAGVPTVAEVRERSSDHWSFVRAGLPAARLGSTPYAGYHSPGDVPSVVERAQLERVGRVVLAWLAPRA
ncbi:Peptidase family M28 [Nocardioides exalbidus]|uniref:Peptidase family M28 n=1 Tax=Nocardioides exalbidus TaxID=402596 RepID=A0A1H4XGR3_9ACTN|nr:M28 family peptidase [Nocardioides exalbidus]SED03924.1 Peptidase family M28 [Nocardioides exalbidus]